MRDSRSSRAKAPVATRPTNRGLPTILLPTSIASPSRVHDVSHEGVGCPVRLLIPAVLGRLSITQFI